ncbi:MAG: DUF3572 domain-containing protein [Rhizobiaceae bacterium]|nr:DUF3572 domain-containing protein [Rhizobiaceae bacterium]
MVIINKAGTETLAIQILEYLAGDGEQLQRFMALTGIEIDDIRQMSGTPELSVALFDYILGNEPTLLSFTSERAIAPESILKARHFLEPPIESSM